MSSSSIAFRSKSQAKRDILTEYECYAMSLGQKDSPDDLTAEKHLLAILKECDGIVGDFRRSMRYQIWYAHMTEEREKRADYDRGMPLFLWMPFETFRILISILECETKSKDLKYQHPSQLLQSMTNHNSGNQCGEVFKAALASLRKAFKVLDLDDRFRG